MQFCIFFFRLLHQAALWDNAELLEDLLNGDEIKCLDSRDSWGRTALHAAATNPGARCLRILAQAGADLDACMGPRGEGMNIRCGRVVRDFESVAKTRCKFQF